MSPRTTAPVEDPTPLATTGMRSPLEPREHSPLELGRRIKMLRVARGMTLKDLEHRGGISATHVSEIERGKASPTVGALGRIAQALGLRPARLVEPRLLPEVTVKRVTDRRSDIVQWGGARIEAVTEPTQDACLSLHTFTLPIGREAQLSHRHEGEEWVMMLSGVAEVRIDGRPFVLREGDAIHFRAHRLHAYANLGSSPAVLLIAGSPRLAV
ncbi:MAG: XRE family transcriptional regulator [Candidatus Eisenbacteria bacterium]